MQPSPRRVPMSHPVSTPTSALRVGAALLFAAALAVGGLAYARWLDAVATVGTAPWWPLAGNVALFTAFALHHSLLARTPLKHWLHRRVGSAVERLLYVIVASVLFLGCCLAWRPLPGTWYELHGAPRVVGYAVQLAGVWVTLVAARTLDVKELAGWTPPGVGPARALETSGLYSVVRHPIYFGWVLLMAGAPTMTATRASFALISIAYLALAIPFEERSLIDAFGTPYRHYQRSVRWKMVPGVF